MSTKTHTLWLLIPIITLIATISHTPKLTQADELQTDATSNITVTDTQSTKAEPTTAFSDVKEGNSHYVAIEYLRTNGIIQGYEDGTFKPEQTVNRAEAVKMLALASWWMLRETRS